MPRPRVSVYLGVSVDLLIAREDGRLDWLERFHDPAGGDYGYAAFFSTIDTLVIGRATYDTVLGFDRWPWEGKRVVVFSHRPIAPRPGVEQAEGALAPALEALFALGARHVYLDGGALVRQGLREAVVDALTLSIVPHLLGSGRPLFERGGPELGLRLLGAEAFPSGLVQLRYERSEVGSPGAGGEAR
ncbi:MAG: dihydrofolate reductase [Myxococcaceae bacterium]|nr:dihydrofolate reductase [Myxococcaceae bacterium]